MTRTLLRSAAFLDVAAGEIVHDDVLIDGDVVGSGTDADETVDPEHLRSVRLALEAGVPIAMGTDNPVTPHANALNEIGLLALGATITARRPDWVELADPEGNEFCLFTD